MLQSYSSTKSNIASPDLEKIVQKQNPGERDTQAEQDSNQ